MASAGPLFAGTVVDDASIGTVVWANATNAQGAPDTVWASNTVNNGQPWSENSIKVVNGGTISGNEKSTGALFFTTGSGTNPPTGSGAWRSWGGPTDLLGLTWQPSDINSSTFGMALSGITVATQSHYLKATNFGFNIPFDASIKGILLEANQDYEIVISSFIAGTQVKTPSGSRCIELIRVGDQILSFNQSGQIETDLVTHLKSRTIDTGTLWISTQNGSVECTPEHRFFTEFGWIPASDLKLKDRIYRFGSNLILDEIKSIIHLTGKKKVYSFTVKKNETYFANGFAVHNLVVSVPSILFIDSFRITVYYSAVPQYSGMMQFFKRIH